MGWGGSTPGGRVHQKGEAAALEDSALQDREFSLREQLASGRGFQIKKGKKKKIQEQQEKKKTKPNKMGEFSAAGARERPGN